jgi:hypothetical protein
MNVFILTGDDHTQDIWDTILGVFDSVELAKASPAITREDGTVIPVDSRKWVDDEGGSTLQFGHFEAKYLVYNIIPHAVLSEQS